MDIAIVGAGAAGAAAAYTLREESVTVFEKSRGVCGRAATRRRGDCTYDYGANYVKSKDPKVNDLLTETVDTDGLVDIEEPVWTFDSSGAIDEGRDGEDHKWTYTEGITQIAKRLFSLAETEVQRETRIERIVRDEGADEDAGRWRLYDTDDTDLGAFDTLLLTPPAPQTTQLLRDTEWADDRRETLAEAVAAVPYRSIITGVLHYEFERDEPWYALVNTDRNHDVGWVAREELKDGHVPDGESLLVAQMAPDWSTARYEDDEEETMEELTEAVAELLGEDRLRDPDWTDYMGWRYALPDEGVDKATIESAEDAGLFFAGDWVAGEGRVHLALRNGLDVGERIRADHRSNS
ncbi:NAD(P)/FAD-dependent oxidoreductase [Natronomonas sp. EA1]|uniref:NAD(P)/FAD-dependent oxidoreductase n=1 Tax=Natronomonas sp. EA1 TaxID=3421655 RepID=UPI003EBE2654